MNIILQFTLSATILLAGLLFINFATRMVEYYEYQDRFNPESKRYRQYVCYTPDAKIKYDLKIARISPLKVTGSPISARELRRIG